MLREANENVIGGLAELHDTFTNYGQNERDDEGTIVHLDLDDYEEDKGAQSSKQGVVIGAATTGGMTICLRDDGKEEKEEEERKGGGEGEGEKGGECGKNYVELETDTDYETVYNVSDDEDGNERETKEYVPVPKRKLHVPKGEMSEYYAERREKKLALKQAMEEYNLAVFPESSTQSKAEVGPSVRGRGRGNNLLKLGGHEYNKKK